jgi:hypothetical protein
MKTALPVIDVPVGIIDHFPCAQRVQIRRTHGASQTGERDCFPDVIVGFWDVIVFHFPYL